MSGTIRKSIIVCLAALLGPSHLGGRVGPQAQPPKANVQITISAAASLKDALSEIQRAFAQLRPDIRATLNLGASGTLELQIEHGAPVDLFLSAATEQMDALEAKNLLLPETRVNLLENELVLIAPRDSSRIEKFTDLAQPDIRVVAMGDPRSVPAGAYAEQALTSLGIYDTVRRKAVLATDVRQVLADVETASADAGLVYATDAATSSRVRVVATAPPGSHQPIVYPAAVLRDSSAPKAAEDFEEFLRSGAARAIFVKFGFRPAASAG